MRNRLKIKQAIRRIDCLRGSRESYESVLENGERLSKSVHEITGLVYQAIYLSPPERLVLHYYKENGFLQITFSIRATSFVFIDDGVFSHDYAIEDFPQLLEKVKELMVRG